MNPPYQSPVYQIRRVPLDQIRSNAYNPNSVAPPEMKLLYQSIKEDGYTMPIVCYQLEDGTYEIVDGFHRCQIMKTYRDIYEREDGMMPVAVIDKPLGNRMASTIRHNRARGSHNIGLMTSIIQELTEAGMSDAWILKNLLINYGKGDTIYVGIYSTVVALISAACALALKARHDRGEK